MAASDLLTSDSRANSERLGLSLRSTVSSYYDGQSHGAVQSSIAEQWRPCAPQLQQAGQFMNDRWERGMDAAHKFSMQLRAAEDRSRHLQAERDQFQDRAARAEEWLRRVYHEVEEKLISPRAPV